jgi:uncharacterized protein DUF6600
MDITHQLRRVASVALIGCGMAFGALSTPIVFGALTPAAAQISEDAQIALEQYGTWRPHPRFGSVWVPNGVPPDWRPYSYGHWVYTDEWGWYWVSDDVEADWGWVAFHYGRWVFERGFGWFWVPGEEWAPAWVDWRYGDDYSGWAPLPPDELIETYEIEPAYWVFVPTRFIAAPRLRTYYVPLHRRSVILRSTYIVNRTFPVRGQGLAVNPGISPAFVARVSGAPVSTYRVRPRVLASTQGVAGAVQIRREDLRGARGGRPGRPGGPAGPGARPRLGTVSVERTTAVIQPSTAVTAPQPLGKNEPGRLGTHPPRAAQGVAPAPSVTPPPGQTPSAPPPPPPPRSGGPTPPPGTGLRSGPPATTTAPATTTPKTVPPGGTPPADRLERREERRDLRSPGGGAPPAGQSAPPTQPNIVRPIPPQTPPPPPPPPPQQRQVQPPPPPAVRPPPPPPPPQQRQVQPPPPPPAARAPAPPPPQGAPPKKPPPKPGEKPPEPPK